MRAKAVAILWVAVLAAAAAGQERYVKLVDEGPNDASFLAFRTKLIAAAERKDLQYVKSIMDPKITLSFGGHVGVKAFDEKWPNKDEFWDEFTRVITKGGRFCGEGRNKRDCFTAPYLFSDMPEDLDHWEYQAIFGNNVNLREKPEMNARVVAQLSYNVVKVDEESAVKRKTGPREWDWKYDWHKVETLGGLKGWVKAEFVRSSVDYRAGFEKKRGQWKMTFFVAGD